MPILSMFYGIVFGCIFMTTNSITGPTCMQNTLESIQCSASTLGRG